MRSLFWLFHQESWELLWSCSDPCMVIEFVRDALNSVLVPKPFVRMGRVVLGILCSFAHRRRWARFLYHFMPRNIRKAIKIPRAKPTEMPMITNPAWRPILWSFFKFWLRKHLSGQKCHRFTVIRWRQIVCKLENLI